MTSEFTQTRKSRGRKTAARFLALEAPFSPQPDLPPVTVKGSLIVTNPLSLVSQQGLDVADVQNTPDPAATTQGEEQRHVVNVPPAKPKRTRSTARTSTTSPASAREPEGFDTTGWGGDYNLPQHTS